MHAFVFVVGKFFFVFVRGRILNCMFFLARGRTDDTTDIYFYSRSQKLYEIMDFASKGIPEKGFATAFIISQIIIGILVVGLLIAFYWLIYGILLKKLNKNYKELKKIDD